MGWPFIWNARYRALHATNPGDDLKTDPDRGLCRPYLVLLPVGFTAAATVAGRSVRSYRTVSPLLRQAGAVLSLWHYPWGRPRRVLPGTVFSWSPDFPPED